MNERELFIRHLGLPSFRPMGLDIVKAEGIRLFDRGGKEYLDLVSGISVSNTGHRHPRVLDAIRKQIDDYLYLNVYGEFIQSPQVQYAKKLTDRLPADLDSVYFVNSGSEAVEGAVKLAKRYTGRTEVISFNNAYHGSTQGALSLLGNETLKNAFRPLLPDVSFMEFNNTADLKKITDRSACVIVETIQAEAGLILPSEGYLNKLHEACRGSGTLLIVDDVQMGMGRTGKLFSFEHYGFTPDILILAKALGAGMPLGAFISARKIMDSLAFNPELGHITTFGGHPVSCAAGMAGLEVIEEVLEGVEGKGKEIESRLSGHPALAGIRRKGLAIGLDLREPGKRELFSRIAIEKGLITDWYLFKPATFRIAPPLVINNYEIDLAIAGISEVLDDL